MRQEIQSARVRVGPSRGPGSKCEGGCGLRITALMFTLASSFL